MANGDGRSDAGNFVNFGLFHALEKLAGIRGERFDVAALALGVDGVKSEGGFAGAADASDDRDGVVRNFDSYVAEVVRAGAADANGFLFGKHGDEFFGGQGEVLTARFVSTA